MKKIASLIALTIAASAAQAGTATISGNLANWKSWNAASKAPLPYANAVAGVDLVQGSNSGDATDPSASFLSIAVTGTATFDDVTGAITALSLSQVGSFTGWYDTDSDSLTDDSITISGLQWSYAGGMISQTNNGGIFDEGSASWSSPLVTGCASDSPVCSFTVKGSNLNDHGNGLGQSVFDFQGIAAGFKTLPRSNNTNSGYGTFSYKVWAATAGASAITDLNVLDLGAQARVIDVASMVNSGTVTTNAANTAKFNLNFTIDAPEVPVPAAAWLMGSGLVGLAGVARRRKTA